MYNDEELLVEMEEEVKRLVRNYATDFYVHDKKFLSEYKGKRFVWSVGDYGTHIGPLPDRGVISGIASAYARYDHFIADRETRKLTQVSIEDLVKWCHPSFPARHFNYDRNEKFLYT